MSGIATALLGDIADLQAGVGFPKALQGRTVGDYPLAKVGDISHVGRSGEAVISGANHYVDEGDLAVLRARPIPAGSVLFAKIGEAIRQNHRVIAGCALLVDNNAMAAIPTERVQSRYLYHFLRTVDFYALASATTVPALRKSVLERLPVPLPPLPEQKRIAGILDAADALRAKRRESLAQLDTLLQSTFLEMFGDPVTNPSTFLEDVCELITDGTHQTPIYADEGVKFLSSKNVKTGEINWNDIKFIPESLHRELHKRLSPQRNDLLLAKNGTTGTAAIVDRDDIFDIYVSLALLRPTSSISPVYLLHAINSDQAAFQFKRALKGVGVPNLHLKEIRKTRIPLPPIYLQRRFAVIVESVERQKALQRAHLAELDTLFASLQSRAFRGDL